MEAIFGESSCIDSWMQLGRKVSWNFPGLETEKSIDEHKQTVLKFMSKKQALCVRNQETVAGGDLISSRGSTERFYPRTLVRGSHGSKVVFGDTDVLYPARSRRTNNR